MYGACVVLYLRYIRHRRSRCAADRHARLQVVDQVADAGDEDEEKEDDDKDDDVALHFCGGERMVWWMVGLCGVELR
jgi:hypothetical protein